MQLKPQHEHRVHLLFNEARMMSPIIAKKLALKVMKKSAPKVEYHVSWSIMTTPCWLSFAIMLYVDKMYMQTQEIRQTLPEVTAGTNAFSIETPPDHIKLHTLMCVCGARGSGKSYFVSSLLQWLKAAECMDRVIIVSPTYESNLSQFKALNVAPEDCFDPEDSHLISKLEKIINDERDDLLRYRQELKVFKLLKSMYWSRCFERDDDAILPILTQYYDVVSNTWKPPKHRWNGRRPVCAVFVDDAQSTNIMRPKKGNNFLSFCLRHRHVGSFPDNEPSLGVSVFINIQSYTSQGGALPRAIRNNCTHFALFKTKNAKELKTIAEELSGEVDQMTFMEVYDYVMGNPNNKYPMLFVDLKKKDSAPSMFREGYSKYILHSA